MQGGLVVAHGCHFVGSEGTHGGAVAVGGGKVDLIGCLLLSNRATVAGGALYVSGGSVLLHAGTLLFNNTAPLGATLHVAAPPARLEYALPAPLGR